MKLFPVNVLLAFAWAIINGTTEPREIAVGFVVGFLILWVVSPASERSQYHGRLLRIFPFALWYLGDLVQCNLRVARDVLTPVLRNRPGIVAVPLDCETDAEITMVMNLVSLTPGSLSLSLSQDRKTLFVHLMDVDPERVDEVVRELKDGIEHRALRMIRGENAIRLMRGKQHDRGFAA